MEFEKTYELIKSNFYNDVFYIFNFTSEAEKKDIKELMEDKADKTFLPMNQRILLLLEIQTYIGK